MTMNLLGSSEAAVMIGWKIWSKSMSIGKGDILEPYVIKEPLSNKGGMSRLFLAEHRGRPQYKAVIKVHLTGDDHRVAFQDLLKKEARILKSLHHPGIVRIYPLRIDRKTVYTARAHNHKEQPWYLALEYINGKSLAECVDRVANKFPLEWGIELFYQLLVIVNFMHKLGYAHCDLKPANVLLRYPPNPNQVPSPVLIDFGSASPIGRLERLTASIRYSPPEVLMAMDREDIPLEALSLRPDKIDIWA